MVLRSNGWVALSGVKVSSAKTSRIKFDLTTLTKRLADGNRYRMRVKATNSIGTSQWSSWFVFTTGVRAPKINTPISFTDGEINCTGRSWAESNGTYKIAYDLDGEYQLDISEYSSFSNTIYTTTSNSPVITIGERSLPAGKKYYVRARRKGTTAYSIYIKHGFDAIPGNPAELNAFLDAQRRRDRIYFDWPPVLGAEKYSLAYDDNRADGHVRQYEFGNDILEFDLYPCAPQTWSDQTLFVHAENATGKGRAAWIRFSRKCVPPGNVINLTILARSPGTHGNYIRALSVYPTKNVRSLITIETDKPEEIQQVRAFNNAT